MKTEINFKKIDEKGFNWEIKINNETFEYFTSFGHCKNAHILEQNNRLILNNCIKLNIQPENTLKINVSELDDKIKTKIIQVTIPKDQGVVLWNLERLKFVYVIIPKIDDVLNCLFLDSQASIETFEDFCLDFGYDIDSRSAFKTYEACKENHFKLLRALGSSYENEKQRIESLEI